MNPIEASELIVNNRGAVYHLNLRPEELANTVITVGDPGRVKEVSKYFDHIEVKREHREFITHTGYIGKKRISVVSTGIGPDNIDIVINELDALVNVDFNSRLVKNQLTSLHIFRLGTSGSLQDDIPVDGLVAGTHGIGLDNLLHFYQTQNTSEEAQLLHTFISQTNINQPFSAPYIAAASPLLLSHFDKPFHRGITVTCPGFYAPQGRMVRLPLAKPDLVDLLQQFKQDNHRIANFEMETSAIYGLGKLAGHECLSLNVIVANRIRKQFSADAAAAVENLLSTSLEIIEKI
ncbi:MAG: nucleoside phosphorylase [Chitinophagaceae bacterium]|nr:nucleoside phosphorylase [Chitinophagaceae bacterium]